MENYIEIPQKYVEPLLNYADDNGLSVEEAVEFILNHYLERKKAHAEERH